MLAFGLAILLFVFWTVVGFALLAVCQRKSDPLRNVLLAPSFGTAVILLPVFWINRLGVPVSTFGIPVALVLLATSVFLLWRFRPSIPWKNYIPFLALFLVALLLTGRPMLEFGFDWVSYANDDMANYALAAQRFLNNGFFDVPDAETLVSGKDYSLVYWFLYVGRVRPGSELFLAWVCSITKLNAHQVFMPTILALHLALISATGGIVYQLTASRRTAWFSCLLLSCSALNTLGTLYQLIAQVYGLALLILCITFIPTVFSRQDSDSYSLKFIPFPIHSAVLPASILITALFIAYPEVLPFLGLTFLGYIFFLLVRKQFDLRSNLITLGLIAIMSLVLINTYAPDAFYFLLSQFNFASGISHVNVGSPDNDFQVFFFPYFLIPSGLASLWGFQNIAKLTDEPLLSFTIFLGGFLLLGVAIACGFLLRFRKSTFIITSITTAIMLCLALALLLKRRDFGLFKLAMFLQPFMLSTLVIFWFNLTKKFALAFQILPLIVISLLNLPVQQSGYIETSRGIIGVGLVEVPNGSKLAINSQFENIVNSIPATQPEKSLLIDTSNVVLAKFQSLYTRGIKTTFLSRDYFNVILAFRDLLDANLPFFSSKEDPFVQQLKDGSVYRQLKFDMLTVPPKSNDFGVKQDVKEELERPENLLITTVGDQDVFNRRTERFSEGDAFQVLAVKDVKNHLVFVHSTLGQHYYSFKDVRRISIYQPEVDWFLSGQTMMGLGRHFLFQIINPSPKVRLVLNMTASLKNNAENMLPTASIIGQERHGMGMVGRGSARTFSPPISPQVINGNHYLGLDMGMESALFPDRRTGLMRLYGLDIPSDRRNLVGYGRDISLISEQDYDSLNPPSYLDKFPVHLTNPDLEYSGLYEDGWASEAAFVGLKQQNLSQLKIAGQIPLINDPRFSTQLVVLLDGQEIGRKTLGVGDFKLNFSVPPTSKRRRVELRFSKLQALTAPDGRPTAALLKFLGFTNSVS